MSSKTESPLSKSPGGVLPVAAGSPDSLVVRQHERISCRLDAVVSVGDESGVRVALSRNVGTGDGFAPAVVVDCSAGGLGLESSVFLPRGSSISVQFSPASSLESNSAPIRVSGMIQRSTMISRAPRYYLGIAYGGPQAPDRATVDSLISAAKASANRTSTSTEEARDGRP